MTLADAVSLDDLVGGSNRVRSVYQPIVDLETRVTVGYEALARFPNHPDRGPSGVFARAREIGVLGDLDWTCRRAAMMGALDAGLTAPMRLFVNLEPGVMGTPPPWRVDPRMVSEAIQVIPTVIELTERSLLEDPRSVLWAADWARERSCLIALDDVGVNPESVAMLSIVRPDIIKLDRVLLGDVLTGEQHNTLRAVWDHVGASDARILCEGIESEADLHRARALGATLVQGFHLGRPAPMAITAELLAAAATSTALDIRAARSSDLPSVPTDILRTRPTRISPLREIAALGAGFEAAAAASSSTGIVLLSVHLPELFTPEAAEHYARLATRNTLVGVIGVGEDVPVGVRGARIRPLRDHVAFVVVDPDNVVAGVARELDHHGPIAMRRHEWALTRDEREVTGIARALLRRLAPADGGEHVAALVPGHATPGDQRQALTAIMTTAAMTVPGAESVGVSLYSFDHGLATVAANDQYPFMLDQLQQLYGVGPSLDPPDDDPVIEIADLDTDARWPVYRRVLTAAAPIGSVLSFRLFTATRTSGILTFYAQQSHAFDAEAVAVAVVVARCTQRYWMSLRSDLADTAGDVATVLPNGELARLVEQVTGPDADGSQIRAVLDDAVRLRRPVRAMVADRLVERAAPAVTGEIDS